MVSINSEWMRLVICGSDSIEMILCEITDKTEETKSKQKGGKWWLKQAGVQLAVIYLGLGWLAFVSRDGFCGAELEVAHVY